MSTLVIATIEAERPPLVVVDSVQTLRDAGTPGPPGSVSQVRASVLRMTEVAKATGVPVLLVGHVTKEGAIAGPRTLEHMVDVVLYLEGERLGEHRMLRGIKNRFGATGEVGLFTMERDGMRDLDAPSRGMLDAASLGASGSVVTITCDGLRPMAVEVQALAVASPFEFPRRTASGFELNRLHLMLAVLTKRAGITIPKLDVFVNVAGGIRLDDPGTDLAVALAIAGSMKNRAVSRHCAVIGELGLGGEVRRVSRTEVRLAEAAAVGMEAVILPESYRGEVPAGPSLSSGLHVDRGSCTTRVTVVSRGHLARRSCGSIAEMHTHAARTIRRARNVSRIIGASVGFVFGVLYGVFILSGTPGVLTSSTTTAGAALLAAGAAGAASLALAGAAAER